MPVRHQGLWNQTWEICQRCSFEYPKSMMTTQNGLRVCTVTCFDNEDNWGRQQQIAQILQDGRDDNIDEARRDSDNTDVLMF